MTRAARATRTAAGGGINTRPVREERIFASRGRLDPAFDHGAHVVGVESELADVVTGDTEFRGARPFLAGLLHSVRHPVLVTGVVDEVGDFGAGHAKPVEFLGSVQRAEWEKHLLRGRRPSRHAFSAPPFAVAAEERRALLPIHLKRT